MKKFAREVVRDATVLSVLVIAPMSFLGPGWTRPRPTREASFAQQHQQTSEDAEQWPPVPGPDRDIPMLKAFEVERAEKKR